MWFQKWKNSMYNLLKSNLISVWIKFHNNSNIICRFYRAESSNILTDKKKIWNINIQKQ